VVRLQSFYMVGPELAPYMICDWQLWHWNEGLIDGGCPGRC
jgi:hypothetical protein